MSDNSVIKTEGLAVGYGRKIIADGIELHAHQGKIVTLIGPNGSGKSTILKSIAAQLRPIAGTVYIEGKAESSMKRQELARKLSVVMTERIEPELMTCGEVIESGRYPYTGRLGILSDNDRKKADEAMRLVRVSELRDSDFSRISDGQRQRVMLAKAICQEPEVLVLDEPTSFLDIRHKLELLSILKNLVCEKQLAVVMSLHEIELARQISDTIVCIKNGKVDRSGTAEEIFRGDYICELYDIDNELIKSAEGAGLSESIYDINRTAQYICKGRHP